MEGDSRLTVSTAAMTGKCTTSGENRLIIADRSDEVNCNDLRLIQGFLRDGPVGRGERIRTSGLYVPNVALYQAKLHPDCCFV